MPIMIWASTGTWQDVVYDDRCWVAVLLGLLIMVGIINSRRKR